MHKTDSADFTNRVKCLLELMENNSAKDSPCFEDEEYASSCDTTDTEGVDSDGYSSDLDEEDEDLQEDHSYDRTFHLNKFFADAAKDSGKFLSSAASGAKATRPDDHKFEKKMYRVISLRLDDKAAPKKFTERISKN